MTKITVLKTKEPEHPHEYARILSEMTIPEASIILSLSGLADDEEEFEQGVWNVVDRGGELANDPEKLREMFPDLFEDVD